MREASFTITPLIPQNRDAIRQFVVEHWGSTQMVVHGTVFDLLSLPGFVAVEQDKWLGLLTYCIEDNACEIVSLDSLREGIGIGSALVETLRQLAVQQRCKRLFLTTTNDNLHALRFYQRRGFTLAALRINALAEARKLKPEIPLMGNDGIPLRDEIDLELFL